MADPAVRVWCSTPGGGAGAIACVDVCAANGATLKRVCDAAGVRVPDVGALGVRDLCGVDEGVVVRWGDGRATLMPHGSRAVVDAIVERFLSCGALRGANEGVRSRFPEAGSRAEACALATIALSASPMASDVLLQQAVLWEHSAGGVIESERGRLLNRLVEPALVAAVGRANVGKSSLLNALASGTVSVVSPEAGTTRDGVGVLLDLGGLRVRWFDTPGVREDAGEVEQRAYRSAWEIVERADLVLHCADAEHGWIEDLGIHSERVLRCGTRVDLVAISGAELQTSARTGQGVDALADAVRERILPGAVLDQAGRDRWRFHPSLADGSAGG